MYVTYRVSGCIDPDDGSRAGLQNIGLWPICDNSWQPQNVKG